MQRRLELTGEQALADALGAVMSVMMHEAEAQARAAVEAPADALHDYRRAVRRAQAVLALTWPMLRKRQRRQIAAELKRATRRTRTLRDLDAVMPVLGRLESHESDAREAAALQALRRYLEDARAELVGSEITAWRLRKNVRALAGLDAVFRAGLHNWVEPDMLLDSLRAQYKLVREAWRKAAASNDADDLHAWRRAARTLRYELELLASRPSADAGLTTLLSTFEDQVKALGQATDLIALAAIADAADPELLDTDAEALAQYLRGLAEGYAARAFADAVDVFKVKPKSFAWPTEAHPDEAPEMAGPAAAVSTGTPAAGRDEPSASD